MVFLAYFVINLLFINLLNQKKYLISQFNIFYIPFILMWIFIIGLQYRVGTDYDSYLSIFNSGALLYKKKGEVLFYELVQFLHLFTNNGQILFISISAIQVLVTLRILKELKKNNYDMTLIFFYYFSISGIFFNQMNGLRQYVAIPFLALSIIYFPKNIFKSIIFIFIATQFHRSAIIFYPVLLFCFPLKKKLPDYIYYLFVLFILIVSFLSINNIVEFLVSKILPAYSAYFQEGVFLNKLSFSKQIVKIAMIPIYLLSIKHRDFVNNPLANVLYNLGFFSYFVFFIFSEITILVRILDYFRFFQIFPVYFLTKKYIHQKRNIEIFFLLSIVLGLLFLKIIVFPSGEYVYNNVLFI